MSADIARPEPAQRRASSAPVGPLQVCGPAPAHPFSSIREQAVTTTHEQTTATDRMWRDRAACRGGGDPERFFPSAGAGPEYEAQVAAAKAVCTGCPVLAECRAWALHELAYGIAGGMTEDERRQHRAGRRGRSVCRVPSRPVGATSKEAAAAGREAIRAGWSPREVARAFAVAERTAERWAARALAEQGQRRTHEGIRG